MWILAPKGSNPRGRLQPPLVSETRVQFFRPVNRNRAQCTDLRHTYWLSITVALIYHIWLKPLTVVELAGHLNTGSGLKGPALAFSIIDSHLHIS
jgi:hypothetical protein